MDSHVIMSKLCIACLIEVNNEFKHRISRFEYKSNELQWKFQHKM